MTTSVQLGPVSKMCCYIGAYYGSFLFPAICERKGWLGNSAEFVSVLPHAFNIAYLTPLPTPVKLFFIALKGAEAFYLTSNSAPEGIPTSSDAKRKAYRYIPGKALRLFNRLLSSIVFGMYIVPDLRKKHIAVLLTGVLFCGFEGVASAALLGIGGMLSTLVDHPSYPSWVSKKYEIWKRETYLIPDFVRFVLRT